MRNLVSDIIKKFRSTENTPLKKFLRKLRIVWIGIFLSGTISGRQISDTSILDISKIATAQSIDQSIFYTTYKKNAVPDNEISKLDISEKIPQELVHRLPLTTTSQNIYLKFPLFNSADTSIQVYFFPGKYCRTLELFERPVDEPQKSLVPVGNYTDGFILLTLKPKEKTLFYARLGFILTTVNNLSPTIVKKDFISYFRNGLVSDKTTVNLLNYITAGIMLMMIFYSLAVYIQSRTPEFIYYSVYASCIAVLLFLKSYLFGSTTNFNYFFEGFFDFIVQMTGYYFYLLFFRKFLNTKVDHPFLEKVFTACGWIIIISILLFSVTYFGTGEFSIINLIENITKQLLLVVSLIFIFYGLWRKDPLMNYLVTGQLLLTVFSIVSFLLLITPLRISATPNSLLNDSLVYYQTGLVFELIFFMAGLSYKNKRDLIERIKERERLKLENERKEFEKQVAILEAKQQERNRISADMHDELGSGVTAIRLMSEIVKTKMKENTLPEIEKISHSANELINKMNTIIWTMVSSNDTLESLIAYIRAYAVEFFENTPIECHFNIPSTISSFDLSGEKRRNIFLSVKEALNNALKHSHATTVTISFAIDQKLIIEISDNGVGIDLDKIRKFGNGLQNMRKRITSIAGELRIENHQGTRTIFELEL
ncbi:MAG TPA: 7TM diverse intracellular signaling domain-containing protein [Puia sp.]|nr:7TM diverse intracellular signaling domain-containing protein [Puia sp.]